ncbi:MAG: tRNA (N(6)-L-threonylcarbamoyladenosine(37)-C(2))-methylthiotransferase MtaB [Deltaproteobacteria bacterium]|nr:tRNA (N(6)-L-threonylcarbamoyladenosine(37)-C(2))-methylthiotransferase MtaB [Deltaproteobacteria bacterium]
MFKVAMTTLGCKVNQCESAGIAEAMATRGIVLVPFETEADCYIVNTCTVTGRTDDQSRRLIRQAVRRNPAAAVLATGCYAQRAPDEIARIPGVRIVAGNGEKSRLPELIEELSEGKGPQVRVGDIAGENRFSPLGPAVIPGHTRAFLKIQDGCDALCSYCIVPRVRGASRSLPPAEVERGLASLAGRGFREAVLSGIHLGAYGRDLAAATDLTAVVRRIAEERPMERLRLSSIEPREITGELLALIGSPGIVCRHLHIPLQSGDDGILASMNRDYDAAFFRDLINTILAAIPGIAIGIDVIAGFPGESEAAFANTVRLVEELPFAYLHAFPFSRRPGTPAAAMPRQVPEADKKRRVERLRSIGAEKRRIFAETCIGAPLTVLIEGKKDRATGWFTGFSDNYIPVVCHGAADANRIVRVLPGSFRNGRLIAEVLYD